jgi:site-specific DNA-methyltransferase (adenine-specific)
LSSREGSVSQSHSLDYYPEDATGDERGDMLALVDRGRAALALARTLADIGDVMTVAERARRWAKAAQLGIEAENHAAVLWLDAARKAGEHVEDVIPREGGRPAEKPRENPSVSRETLAGLGITQQQSKDWRLLAALPEPEYQDHIGRTTSAQRPLRLGPLVDQARKRIRAERRAAEPPPLVMLDRPDVRIDIANALDLLHPKEGLPVDDESVDLIVTSPPYGLDVGYTGGDVLADQWPAFMLSWLVEAYRVTKPSGRLALNVPLDTSEPTYRPAYAQAVAAAMRAGWDYRSTIVWAEGNTTKGGWALGSQSSAARPHHVSQVEMIGLFSKGPWGPSSSNPDDITPDEFLVAGRGPWAFSGEARAWEGHPAPFPLELPSRLIPYLSRVGDVVLDPFCGSGTTLLAAVRRSRQAWGFDISPEYVESARRRLAV